MKSFGIKSVQQALRRSASKRVVLIGGVYDLAHIGHCRALTRAKAHGDLLVVLVASDALVRSRKGPTRPILSAAKRAELIAGFKPVDLVFVSNKLPYSPEVLGAIRPDVLVVTAEKVAQPELRIALPKALAVSPHTKVRRIHSGLRSVSTTKIIAKAAKSHASTKTRR